MKELKNKYRFHFGEKDFLVSFFISLFLITGSFFVNYYAGIYATESASNSVTDIILNNIPIFNVNWIFIYGPLLLWGFVAFLILKEPKRIPFILKSLALFVLIRSLFITLTHIGPFPDQMSFVANVPNILQNFMFGGDLFFSGHTGSPFLMALVFWRDIRLRLFFIATTILFGVVVLMAHLHYSIDVLSAVFITYTIFHIAKYVFRKDYQVFLNG